MSKYYNKAIRVTLLLFIILSFIACQGYRQVRQEEIPRPVGKFQAYEKGNVRVLMDVVTPQDSKQLFGLDLTELNIQPVNVQLENNGQDSIEVHEDGLYVRDRRGYLYKILRPTDVGTKIYDSDKYQILAKEGAKSGIIFGAIGAGVGTLLGAVIGGVAGGTTAGKGAGTGAAIGGATGAAAGAIKGTAQAREKTIQKISENLMSVSLKPGTLPSGTKTSGLLFFNINREDMESLKVDVRKTGTSEKLELDIEIAPR